MRRPAPPGSLVVVLVQAVVLDLVRPVLIHRRIVASLGQLLHQGTAGRQKRPQCSGIDLVRRANCSMPTLLAPYVL